jgi:hypothetical protein
MVQPRARICTDTLQSRVHADLLGRLQAIQDLAEAVLIDCSTLEPDLVNWVPVASVFFLLGMFLDLRKLPQCLESYPMLLGLRSLCLVLLHKVHILLFGRQGVHIGSIEWEGGLWGLELEGGVGPSMENYLAICVI